MLLIIFDDDKIRRELLIKKHTLKFKSKKGYQILVALPENIPFILSLLLKDYPDKVKKARDILLSMGGKIDFPSPEEQENLTSLLSTDAIVTLFDVNWENWYDKNFKRAGLQIGELLDNIVPVGFHTRYDLSDVNEKATQIGSFFLKTEDAQDIDNILKAVEDGFYEFVREEKVKYDMFLMSDSDWCKKLTQRKGLEIVNEKTFYLGTLVLRNAASGIWRYVAIDEILFIVSDANHSHLYCVGKKEAITINCNLGTIEKQFQPFWEANQPNPFWNLQRVGNQIINIKHIDYRTREYLYFKNTTHHIDISASDGVELDEYMLVLKMKAS